MFFCQDQRISSNENAFRHNNLSFSYQKEAGTFLSWLSLRMKKYSNWNQYCYSGISWQSFDELSLETFA